MELDDMEKFVARIEKAMANSIQQMAAATAKTPAQPSLAGGAVVAPAEPGAICGGENEADEEQPRSRPA